MYVYKAILISKCCITYIHIFTCLLERQCQNVVTHLQKRPGVLRLICAFDIGDTTFNGFIDISGQVFWFIALEAMHFMHNMQIQK